MANQLLAVALGWHNYERTGSALALGYVDLANLGPVLAWVAHLTPLWHGVNLSRMLTLDTVDLPLAAVHVAVLAALVAVGWHWSVTGLAKRLAD